MLPVLEEAIELGRSLAGLGRVGLVQACTTCPASSPGDPLPPATDDLHP